MKTLLHEIKNCSVCLPHLSHGVRPVMSAHTHSKIAIIGQAPGSAVHQTGIPWDDPSGIRLRAWLDVSDDTFYDPEVFALVPMGFCYPGKGTSGDLPPRPECAPQWHSPLFKKMNQLQLILLVGSYAQQYYLQGQEKSTLTETVRNYQAYLPTYLPLPHPSPRNNIWLKKNEWFDESLIPALQEIVKRLIV